MVSAGANNGEIYHERIFQEITKDIKNCKYLKYKDFQDFNQVKNKRSSLIDPKN